MGAREERRLGRLLDALKSDSLYPEISRADKSPSAGGLGAIEFESDPNARSSRGQGGAAAASSSSSTAAQAGSSHEQVAGAGAEAPDSLAARVQQQLYDCLDPGDLDAVHSSYTARCQHPSLYTFCGTDPANGVGLLLPGDRYILVPRATQDGGCVPNLITQAFADKCGIAYHPFPAGATPAVRDIEGKPSARMIGATGPVSVVLARGSAEECTLPVPQGFIVVAGHEVGEMYDVVLGRRLLAAVSGFVMPLLQQFCYMPHLQDTTASPTVRTLMRTLPITVGYARPSGHGMADTAAAFGAPPPYLICAGLQEHAAQAGATGSAQVASSELRTDARSSGGHMGAHAAPHSAEADSSSSSSSSRSDMPTASAGAPAVPSAPAAAQAGAGAQGCWLYRGISRLLSFLLTVLCWLLLTLLRAPHFLVTLPTQVWCAAVQQRPYQEKGKGQLHYRTGQVHRAADGGKIRLQHTPGPADKKPDVYTRPTDGKRFRRHGKKYHRADDGELVQLRCPAGASGNKPKVVEVLRPRCTLRYLVTAVPARTLLLLCMLLLSCVTSTLAMQANSVLTGTHIASRTLLHVLPQDTSTPMVPAQWGSSFRCSPPG
jgi:hypothetical protein